nr:MAG TPA: hypothetical protein [Caudoviricetes sp.]
MGKLDIATYQISNTNKIFTVIEYYKNPFFQI